MLQMAENMRSAALAALVLGILQVACATAPANAASGDIAEVSPVKIFTSDASLSAPSAHDGQTILTIEIFGEELTLVLEPSGIADNSVTVEIDEDGVERPVYSDARHYRGFVKGHSGSNVRISVANGQHVGVIYLDDEILVLEPSDLLNFARTSSAHVGYRMSDVEFDPADACATEAESPTRHSRRRGQRRSVRGVVSDLPSYGAVTQGASGGFSRTEIALVGDFEYVSDARWPSGYDAASWMVAVINSTAAIYETEVNVTFDIVSNTTYASNNDPFSIPGACSTGQYATNLLSEFAGTRGSGSYVWSLANSDVAHLFTGRELCGASAGAGVIGIAHYNGICTNNAGVSESYSTNLGRMATLLAHELGHNFNAPHVSNCSPHGSCCIMLPSLGCSPQNVFSTQSENTIEGYVDTRGCVEQGPPPTPTNTPLPTNTPTHTFTPSNTPTPTPFAYDAEFVSQVGPPSTMNAGEQAVVSVTMRNLGTNTWTAANLYRLGSSNPRGNSTWGFGRMYMDGGAAVRTGETYTFSATVTAPSSPGTYNYQWEMVRDGVAWFGAQSANLVVTVNAGSQPYDAAFVSQVGPPATMNLGEQAAVSVTMRNTGTNTWTAAQLYRLGSSNPRGNMTWGFGRMYMDGGASVAPGQTYTFTATVTAPTNAGTYDYQWEMVRDGVAWFGSQSANVVVTVNAGSQPYAAAFVSQVGPPETMSSGEQAVVSVTLRNDGTNTWTAAELYRLGSSNPRGNMNWGIGRMYMDGGASVGPGQTYTFSGTITAPANPGAYDYQWEMVRDGVTWFGDPSANQVVTVSAGSQPYAASFVSQVGPPLTMSPGEQAAVSVTMRNDGTNTWTAAELYRLGSSNPRGNMTWGFGRMYIDGGTSVAPGQTYTFTGTVTAPASPGAYNYQWEMVRDGVTWFGLQSANLSVVVAGP